MSSLDVVAPIAWVIPHKQRKKNHLSIRFIIVYVLVKVSTNIESSYIKTKNREFYLQKRFYF